MTPAAPAPSATVPPILEGVGDLLAKYDIGYSDVWGVVHNGLTAYQEADAALNAFRADGGTVILVSNAPVPNARVRAMLDERGVSRTAYDDVVSSGDIALEHVRGQGYARLHGIGPADRDAALFSALGAEFVGIETADAILCTGLNDDLTETAEDYLPLLETALARRLAFVCANPDKVVDVGGRLYLCAGAIADLYEARGGDVFWAGKPHASAFQTALARARSVRDFSRTDARVLVIGDALRTDIKGAHNAGVDALFIAGGIHREETMDGGKLCPDKLAGLFEGDAPPAIAAMSQLRL